jgi:hypothetical protein
MSVAAEAMAEVQSKASRRHHSLNDPQPVPLYNYADVSAILKFMKSFYGFGSKKIQFRLNTTEKLSWELLRKR